MIFYPVEYTFIYDIQWNDVLESTIVASYKSREQDMMMPSESGFKSNLCAADIKHNITYMCPAATLTHSKLAK